MMVVKKGGRVREYGEKVQRVNTRRNNILYTVFVVPLTGSHQSVVLDCLSLRGMDIC